MSKSGCTSIRRPPRQHHGQPITRFLLRRRFLRRQLHRHQTTGRRNWITPSLPTQFLQMAIQCAEAQSSTLAKLAPPHTAAHKLGHQLLNFRVCTSFWVLKPSVLRSSSHLNTDIPSRTGVLARRLRLNSLLQARFFDYDQSHRKPNWVFSVDCAILHSVRASLSTSPPMDKDER